MLRDDIDLKRLRTDIAAYGADCARIKRALRTRWLGPMGEHQKHASRLRRELTDRHVLLAWARGRLHVRAPPRAVRDAGSAGWTAESHAARVAQRLGPDYARATEGGSLGREVTSPARQP
jgi:hypothetical protein